MRVLIIAPFYRWFIKELVDTQSVCLDEIHVLLHHNIVAEISKYVPFGGYFNHIRLYTKDKIANLQNKPENVYVHRIPTIYFTPDGKNKKLSNKLVDIFYKYLKKKNVKFDLIHAHFTYPQGYVAVRLGQKFGVPVVVTLHENDMYLRSILENVKNEAVYVWKNADILIRVNRRDIPVFVQYGANPERIIYIPNGYNPKKFPHIPREVARKKLQLETDDKILFNLARLHPAKGHRYLIEAMALVVKKRKDVHCYIGGTGPLKEQLERQTNKLNLEQHIKFLGYLPDEELKYWMNAADLFILPSLSEGNPTVMFEALGVGLPFVGTTVGGVPEIITSEDYGLLCPPADPKCLAKKILIAIEREWNREKIMKYSKQFTWDNIAKRTINVYKNVLGGHISGKA